MSTSLLPRIGFVTVALLLAVTPLLAAAATCPNLYRNLSFGSRGSDVVELQTFLIAQGDLAAGNNTGYFGRLTEAAVKSWQAKNGVVSSGTAATTGYGTVGPRTRAKIASVCGGGTIYANFSASPTFGTAPLSVRFSYIPGAMADAFRYQIDFGDGTNDSDSSIYPPQTSCDKSDPGHCWSYHIYQSSGTYTAKLKKLRDLGCDANPAGLPPGYKCDPYDVVGTVTITVSGSADINLSFSALPTSGTAPLWVTFKAPLPVSDSSLDYFVDFGDGSSIQMGRDMMLCFPEDTSCKDAVAKAGPIGSMGSGHSYKQAGTYTATLMHGSNCSQIQALPPTVKCNSATSLGTVTITVTGTSASSGREFSGIRERIIRDGEALVFVQVSTVGLSSFPTNGTDNEKEMWKAQARVRIQNVLNTLSNTDFTFTNQFDITLEFVGRLKISGYEKLRTNSGVTNITLNNRGSY